MTEETTFLHDPDTVPVACTLTEEEAREREAWMRAELLDHLESIGEFEDGFAFSFADEGLDAFAEFVRLEHDCCPFVDFELHVTPGEETNRLRVSGRKGTKDLFERGFVEPVTEEFDHLA